MMMLETTAVGAALIAMVGLKFWTVWRVAKDAQANREGKWLFLGILTGLSVFALLAKVFISYQLSQFGTAA
ncbi:hypothetical protein ACFFLH_12710 [Balneatrix alpica]|uniref:DUF2788 domain-containing protein n=2 Tax=Balneatrix alpica TaxID=75684 RepID=A0ABV5ZDA3_9GAMM